MKGEDLLTIAQLVDAYPAFPEATIRWWIFNAERNDFNVCLIRIGGRVYIDRQKFTEWIDTHRVVGDTVIPIGQDEPETV